MLFNSLSFAWFLPLVLVGYFALPHRFRWAWLLAASCYFYASFVPKYLLILFLVILVDYAAGILIEQSAGLRRKAWLVLSLAANLFILAVFKYADLLIESVNHVTTMLGRPAGFDSLRILLPIGLSFHTFQSMSYTIEVFLGRQKAERNLGIYSLYVLYFPQLVAGPIERPQNLLPQFRRVATLDAARIRSGLQLMAVGFLKKVVIADNLALLVDSVYAQPSQFDGLSLYLAAVFFSFQILCDFAGYSDIARGVSRVLGVELMVNFRRPYFAASLSEFWRRWHISLSTWFRDYLYIPLGGALVGPWKKMRNLLVVFLLSGLWHGANVTFIVWGLIHGVGICVENSLGLAKYRGRFRWLATIAVFHVVTLAWVFFRAPSIEQALSYLGRLFSWPSEGRSLLFVTGCYEALLLTTVFVLFQAREEWLEGRHTVWNAIDRRPWPVRWAVYVGMVACFVWCGQFGSRQFIYFQF